MKKITQQLLHFVIVACRDGDSQKVKRYFDAFLTNMPIYSNRDHKSGALFVSTDGVIEVYPIFKNTLVENPNKEKFWISYIDAIIKLENLINARKTLQQGRWQGLLEKNWVLWRWDF